MAVPEVGQTARLGKTVTDADLLLFAAVSLDTNPVHMDAEAAAAGVFGERVAHGMLCAGLIGAVMGTRLPGPGSVYRSQTLRFRAPVRIGDTVVATVEVTAVNTRHRLVTLRTTCAVGETVVVEGEATVQAPA